METRIKLASNTIPNSHLDRLVEWIKSYPRLTKGSLTNEFEDKFSKYLDCKHTLFVNSGSSANLLIAAANLYYGNLRNKKIAVPAVSWSTTLSPFIQMGYEPILVDCDKNNLGVNVDHLNEIIKKDDVTSLILVHVLGHDSSIEKVLDICQDKKIRLFEDSCESLGSTLKNKKLGTFGLASTFSFYYGHHISTIEGGAVCTDNDEFANLICSMRSHGWSRDLPDNKAKELKHKYSVTDFRDLYSFYYPGFNLRSTDLNAFLGIQQLELLEKYSKIRSQIFHRYKKNLPEFWSQKSSIEYISSFAYGTFVENPQEVWKFMLENGIESRPLICGSMGKQPFWKNINGGYSNFTYSDQVHEFGIYLPINADLQLTQIDEVCDVFKKIAIPYKIKEKV